MGTISGIELITQVQKDLNDPKAQRWTLADLRNYLNAAQREIAILRPDESVAVKGIVLVPNNTRQTLPADGVRLIDIVRNLGVNGATPGKPVRIIERENLDHGRPNWHADTAQAAIVNYCYDGRSPRTFYVYPMVLAAVSVEAHLQVVPADVQVKGVENASDNTVIALSDLYQTAIYDYMMMRAHAKDTDARDLNESDSSYRKFLQRLGLKVQVDKAFDPNRNSPPREQKRGPQDASPAF